jgi:hypothetical protein
MTSKFKSFHSSWREAANIFRDLGLDTDEQCPQIQMSLSQLLERMDVTLELLGQLKPFAENSPHLSGKDFISQCETLFSSQPHVEEIGEMLKKIKAQGGVANLNAANLHIKSSSGENYDFHPAISQLINRTGSILDRAAFMGTNFTSEVERIGEYASSFGAMAPSVREVVVLKAKKNRES